MNLDFNTRKFSLLAPRKKHFKKDIKKLKKLINIDR